MKMNCGVIVALALVTVLTIQTLDYIYVSGRLGKTLIQVLFWFVWRTTLPKTYPKHKYTDNIHH